MEEFLSGSHKEADTRMIFHVMNADKRMKESGCKVVRAIIKSADTDVVCIAVHFYGRLTFITEVWIKAGMTGRIEDRHRFIPIHEICSAVGSPVCEILPAVHAITGCDTISSFYFIGKKSVMKLVSAKCHEFQDMRALGGESGED